jgi:hypothetical protein
MGLEVFRRRYRTSQAPQKTVLPGVASAPAQEVTGRTTAPSVPCGERVRADALSRADVQRGPGGVRVAQSESAAAPEEARRCPRRLRRADRRGEAAALDPEGLGNSSSGFGSTSTPRKRRAEAAAAGERKKGAREPGGGGAAAAARGQSARRTAPAAASARARVRRLSLRGRSGLPASPPPSCRSRRARTSALPPLPPRQRRAPPSALGFARPRRQRSARASASRLPRMCGGGGPRSCCCPWRPLKWRGGGDGGQSAPGSVRRLPPHPQIPFPRDSRALSLPAPPGAAGVAGASQTAGRQPRSPLPHPSRPKIGLAAQPPARAWNGVARI